MFPILDSCASSGNFCHCQKEFRKRMREREREREIHASQLKVMVLYHGIATTLLV